MKKLLFTLALLLSATSGYSQNIAVDKTYGDSLRILTTTEVVCRSFTDRMVLSVCLSRFILKDGISIYMMNLDVNQIKNCSIPKDGKVTMKLANDSTIELKSINSETGSGLLTHNVIGNYIIDENLLQKLFAGISEVNIDITPKNYNKVFKKDKVGETLRHEYYMLKEYSLNQDAPEYGDDNETNGTYSNVNSTTTTVVNGHIYRTTVSTSGSTFRVHTSGNGINSTTYGYY